jgi:hypothetical protein
MVLRSSAWSLPWEKGILMMLLTPCGVDFVNTLLYHLEALQLSFFSFFLSSLTLSEGYNTSKVRFFRRVNTRWAVVVSTCRPLPMITAQREDNVIKKESVLDQVNDAPHLRDSYLPSINL